MSKSEYGIGARLLRKEDARHLAGRGRFVSDIEARGALEAAIVRSPVAHGHLRGLEIPEEHRSRVFTAEDFPDIKPIRAVPRVPGFKASDFPVFATDKVRYVGQPIAICLAATRAEAEDIASQVFADIEELPAIVDAVEAIENSPALLHEHWGNNVYIERDVDGGDIEAARAAAKVTVSREYRMNRQAAMPLEGRAVLADHDPRRDELVLHLASQGPHVMRLGIAECLGIRERNLRVVSPDVGGGFGSKNRLMPEEVMVAAVALKTGRPVRWIEDRGENLTANNQAREHFYRVTAYADDRGILLGLEADVIVDAGAYSIWPSGPFMETGMAARNLPGPYRLPALHVSTWTVATNKPPLGPYRGVARPGACYAIERTIDEVARAVGRDPVEVRRENMVRPEQMPYDSIGGMKFDNGDYPQSVDKAAEAVGHKDIRAKQSAALPDGRLIGVGLAAFSEQTAHGSAEWVARRWCRPTRPRRRACTATARSSCWSESTATARAWRRPSRRSRARSSACIPTTS